MHLEQYNLIYLFFFLQGKIINKVPLVDCIVSSIFYLLHSLLKQSSGEKKSIIALNFNSFFGRMKSEKGEEEKGDKIFTFIRVLIKCNGSVSKL